jgi:hypothetical protein
MVQGCRQNAILGTITIAELPAIPRPISRNVFLPDDFTEEQKQDIKAALSEWEEKTNGSIKFNIFEHYDKRIINSLTIRRITLIILDIPEDAPMVKELDERESKKAGEKRYVCGYFNQDDPLPTVNIVSSRIKSQEIYTSVVEHELGHALGLEHNPDQNSVMYADQDYSAKHIAPGDVQAFCRLHPCIKKE